MTRGYRGSRYSRAQLNAISHSYTAKTQKDARAYLESVGVDKAVDAIYVKKNGRWVVA